VGRRHAVPGRLEAAIRAEFARLTAGSPAASFAVRSSATAEDLPDASFAGQQETFLNVTASTTSCTDERRSSPRSTTTAPSATACTRASRMRDVALSAGVQRMVRSDLGAPA
jgi:pyruvate,water dikinase